MSNYSNVTEQDLNNLRKVAERRKNERAQKIKNRILKRTHDIKLAESFSPITRNLDESTKKFSEVINPSNSENENNQEKVLLRMTQETLRMKI